MIEIYLAATQAGWYLTPINHHLTGGRDRVHPRRLRGEGVRRRRALRRRLRRRRRDEAELAGARRASRSAAIPGFRPFAALTDGQPTTRPTDRAAGQVMNYTSGTTGRPKGVRRPLTPFDPDTVGSMFAMFLGMFGIQPEDDNVHLVGSPLYHTAVLVFAGSLAALRPHASC